MVIWYHGNNVSWDTEKSYMCGYLYISKNDLLADRLSLSTEEYYKNLQNIYRHYLLHTTCCEELLTNTLLAYKDIEKYNCKMGYFSSDGLYDKDAIYYLAEWIKSNSELNAFVDDIDVKQFAFLIWEKLNRT